jgi:mono/diheme cytochrome c family protein
MIHLFSVLRGLRAFVAKTSIRPSHVLLFSAAAFMLTAGLTAGAQTQPAAAPADEHPKFPPGEGRELTIRVCSACHEAEKAADQQLDLDGWKMMVDQMASMGADATEEQLDQIVHYLANAFPPPK